MSGNQIAFVEHFTKSNSWLHLGGVPEEYVRDYSLTVPGFTGCMDNLRVVVFCHCARFMLLAIIRIILDKWRKAEYI